jgi:hypothetical protein
MRPDDRPVLESQLVAQLTGIRQEIAKLEKQRETLEALLVRVRQEMNLRDVTRKNSLDRILTENLILESLRRTRRLTPTKILFYSVRAISPQLQNTTFRSYLHRLKAKGLIRTVGHGFWVATDSPPATGMNDSSSGVRVPASPSSLAHD